MGYNTEFIGALTLDKPIDDDLKAYINNFGNTRHCVRDMSDLKDKFRQRGHAVSEFLPPFMSHKTSFIGVEKFFAATSVCADSTVFGDKNPDKIQIDDMNTYNDIVGDCPSLWCDIRIDEESGTLIFLSGKFYEYVNWLDWLIKNVIAPSGYKLNGRIVWRGESTEDIGQIIVTNNHIETNDLYSEEYEEINMSIIINIARKAEELRLTNKAFAERYTNNLSYDEVSDLIMKWTNEYKNYSYTSIDAFFKDILSRMGV